MDRSLFSCARKGHVRYAPDEPELRDRLMVPAADGTAWRCLRCGRFVTGGPHDSGPAAAAPLIRWCRPVRQRAFAVGLSAATLILVAACSSGGASAGRPPASTPPAVRQALLAAATQAQQVTSATETVTVQDNTSGTTMAGTLQYRRKPTLLAGESVTVTAAGTSTPITIILAGTAVYLHGASLASQVGKPWVKIDLSATLGASGASTAQLVQNIQGNNFTSDAQLFTTAQNARVAGTQTVGGVTTTEYAGSFTVAAALKTLAASATQALAPELQLRGNSPVYFHMWVDGQHRIRKIAEAETLNGHSVNITATVTAINQPVRITMPPASQTFTPASAPAATQQQIASTQESLSGDVSTLTQDAASLDNDNSLASDIKSMKSDLGSEQQDYAAVQGDSCSSAGGTRETDASTVGIDASTVDTDQSIVQIDVSILQNSSVSSDISNVQADVSQLKSIGASPDTDPPAALAAGSKALKDTASAISRAQGQAKQLDGQAHQIARAADALAAKC